MANYANIKYCDIANGPGIRTSIFLSGCNHHCKNCFNKIAWDFNYGKPLTDEVIDKVIESAQPEYISGITILGGEPLANESNQHATYAICKKFKEKFPNKTIWLYTGFTYEDVAHLPLMKYVDVVVDGLFVEELKDLMLQFRGSSNQRIIDVKKSLETNKTTLADIY